MKRSDELKRERANLIDECAVMDARAKEENRDLGADELTTFNAHLARVQMLEHQIQDELAEENRVRAARAQRLSGQPPVLDFNRDGSGPPSVDTVRVLPCKLASFANEADAYDCGLWLRGVVMRDGEARAALASRRGPEWLASQNEANPVDGGYLVPAPLANAIIVAREQVGALRKLAQTYPMGSDTLAIPKRVGGLTVYYPGEEGAITESDADFGRVNLSAKKRAVLAYVSNELRDDSMIPIVDLLAQEMGHALGLREDQEGIAGDGTSTYGGVLGIRPAVIAASSGIHTAAANHDTWPELDVSDFAGCMSLLPDKYRVPGQLSWLCSAAFKFSVLDRLALGANGALSTAFVDGQPRDFFLGYPVVLSDRMPTTSAASTVACVFGNFPQAVALGDRGGIRVALSEHVAFTTDRLALRATTRYDINVHGAGDSGTVGALVALKTSS